MKTIIALITATLLVYALSSVLAGNWNLFEWHWAMRLIAVIWVLASYNQIMKNNSDNPK